MSKLIYASSSKDSNMFYAVGLPISDPFFYIDSGDKKYVFLDHREYEVFAEYNTNLAIELVHLNTFLEDAGKRQEKTSGINRLALHLLEKYELTLEHIEVPINFPLDMADFLRSHGVKIIPKDPFFPERLIKSQKEITAIQEALHRTHKAFQLIENILRESLIDNETIIYRGAALTSEFLKREVERELLELNMVNVEGLIISCGPHAAIPHHQGSGAIRPHQTIVCDVFPRHRISGYFADMTRTYVKGTPSDKIRKMYDAVMEAQKQAFDEVKPGALLSAPHQKCVNVFTERGYHIGLKGFTHSTGHGLGIDLHEPPYISTRKDDMAVFEAGHVVTIEPGLYYPQIGGVRIEDVVVVTNDGYTNLTNHHKDFVIP